MSSNRHASMLSDALAAGEDRDYQRAAELLIGLISETDEYPQAYLYLGRSFHALGRTERAIQFLHFFIEREPGTGAGHFFLGRAYASEGFYDEAVRHLNNANSLDANNSQILGLLGLVHLKLRNTQVAVELLSRAVEIDPGNHELYTGYLNTLVIESIRRYRRGECDLSRQMLEFLVDRGDTTTLTRLYLAHSYAKLGRYQEALEQYDMIIEVEDDDQTLKLLRADVLLKLSKREHGRAKTPGAKPEHAPDAPDAPDAPTLHRLMAIESFQKGSFRRAVEFAKSVIKQIGADFEMHLLLGDAFRNLASHEKAINHFRRAIALERHRIEPWYGIVLANWQRNRFKEVVQACESIIAIDSDDKIAAYYSALGKSMLERPSEELIDELLIELEKNGPDPFLCTSIGEQHRLTENPGEAERYYRMAIDLSESHRPAYEGLFELYTTMGNREELSELYHAYFDLFPDDPARRNGYIQLLVSMHRFEHAIEQIQLQLPFDGGSEELRRLQAYCYREMAKYREAGILYRQLLKEHPDSEFYLKALSFCLERSGNRDRAIVLMERAFAYKTPTASNRLILGVLLYREGRLDDALKVFRLVLDDYSEDWRAYANIASIYRKKGLDDLADSFTEHAERFRGRN